MLTDLTETIRKAIDDNEFPCGVFLDLKKGIWYSKSWDTIFDSYLHYGCQVWGQNKNASTKEIASIQEKALRIISFKDHNAATGPLYHEKKIIKFFDLISFYNCLLTAEHLNRDLPSPFSGYFTYMASIHNHNTRGALKKLDNIYTLHQNKFLCNPLHHS